MHISLKKLSVFGGLLTIGILGFTWRTIATEPLMLRDLSSSLTSAATTPLRWLASRSTDWLVSDGTRLWSVNTQEETTSYTDRLTERGTLAGIGSNGSSYLLATKNAGALTFTKTDLRTWTTLSDLRLGQHTVRSIEGMDTRWMILTEERSSSMSLPSSWNLVSYREGSPAETLALPSGVSAFVPGCLKAQAGGTLCAGEVRIVPLNNEWYLFAGKAETRSSDGRLVDEGKAGLWRLTQNNRWEAVANAPNSRFISSAWGNASSILFTTTNAVTNPFAADTFWTFDGRMFRSYTNEPLAAGLRSVDTRAIFAAPFANGWLLTAGTTLVRFENSSFTVEGRLRRVPTGLIGSSTTRALLTTEGPSLLTIGTSGARNDASLLIDPIELPRSNTAITRFTLTGIPANNRVLNGQAFTFHVQADDADGISSTDILVHGARIKTCQSASCSFTQTYWTNGLKTRELLLSGRATDKNGNIQTSDVVRLTVEDAPVVGALPSATPEFGRMPAGLAWQNDAGNGISRTMWITPSSSTHTLYAGDTRTFHVAGFHASGIREIRLWVNGTVERSCAHAKENGLWFCSATLSASSFPVGTEIFVNAQILSNEGKESWTEATRLRRE